MEFKLTLNKSESLDWIKRRRSVYPKEFTNPDVIQSELEALFEVARYAPTHKVTEPWRFVVFFGQGKTAFIAMQERLILKEIQSESEAKPKLDKLGFNTSKSAAIAAIVMKRDPQKRVPKDEELWSVACAVQNIQLHASALDLGVYWSTGGGTNHPFVREILRLNSNDVHMGWLYIGRFKDFKKRTKDRLKVKDIIDWRLS